MADFHNDLKNKQGGYSNEGTGQVQAHDYYHLTAAEYSLLMQGLQGGFAVSGYSGYSGNSGFDGYSGYTAP